MSYRDRPDLIQRVVYHGLYSLDRQDQDWLRRELYPPAVQSNLDPMTRDLMIECDCQFLVSII